MAVYEDPGEATDYQRVLKARSSPIIMSILRKASSRPILEINVILAILACLGFREVGKWPLSCSESDRSVAGIALQLQKNF